MQPAGLTVALATILLVAAFDVGAVRAAATLHPTHLTLDQYSPLPPHHRRGVYERTGGEASWKDQDPEDQPFDVSIASRGPIDADGPPRRAFEVGFSGRDFMPPQEDIALSKDDFPPLGRRQLDSLATVEGDDYRGAKVLRSFSREIMPTSELDDPFVADDTFQDQGPGSVEIYKLDLFKEKTLLNATPTVKAPVRGKSKIPKKTARVNWKTKTSEYKSTSPKIVQKQSNFYVQPRTEASSSNGEAFGVGGVPELQVGCEGLEASSHKLKRSVDMVSKKEKALGTTVDPWLHVTPVSINLDYDDLSGEEGYEEMDELLKLKKFETTTKGSKQNRGDMDASFLGDNFFRPPYPEKLPVRGDLGKVPTMKDKNSFTSPTSTFDNDEKKWTKSPHDSGIESTLTDEENEKSKVYKKSYEYSLGLGSGRGRKLLWADDSEDIESVEHTHFPSKRSILWGFGEDEGAVNSNELREQRIRQEENERRRQEYERSRQEAARRRGHHGRVNSSNDPEVERIRLEYERMLEEREKEIEARRQGPGTTRPSNSWQNEKERTPDDLRRREEENRRRPTQYPGHKRNDDARRKAQEDEMRRERERWIENERRKQELEDLERRAQQSSQDPEQDKRQRTHEEEMRRRQELSRQLEERRRQEELRRREDMRRRQEIEDARRRQEEEARRQEMEMKEHNNRLAEQRRRQEEDERRRRPYENPERNLSESDRRDLEERRREWMLKRQQAEEEERRRQERNRYSPPENLVRPDSRPAHNDSGDNRRDEERRLREQHEIERERKLRDYVNRNRPINVDRLQNRQREEDERRRQEEERAKLEETRRQEEERRRLEAEHRRYRPDTHYPQRNQTNSSRDYDEEYQRRLEEHRRRLEEERRLQDYIRRNQPTSVPNQNVSGRNWYEERRTIEAARQYDRTRLENNARRHHGPSAPTNVDPRDSLEAARRRQEVRRLQEETRRTIEIERQAAEERRKEAARREEEARRLQSSRYEEERRRQMAARMEEERRRKEMIEEQNRRTHGGRQRPRYEDRYSQERRAQEQRRRQNASLVPSKLVLDENRRAIERNRQREERERRRQEEERLRDSRQRVNTHSAEDHWRRQEESRLNSLPVSTRIIIRPGGSPPPNPQVVLLSKGAFGTDVEFQGINPNRGIPAPGFPSAPVKRPTVQTPEPCVWALIQCCPSNRGRLARCFETMGCPGLNWDPNPCRLSIISAANTEVTKYYEAAKNENDY